MKIRKLWKRRWVGVMIEDLKCIGAIHKKGDRVIVRKKRTTDEDRLIKGEFEYHYTRESDDYQLIRSTKFLIIPDSKKIETK